MTNINKEHEIGCACCKNKLPFEMPDDILEACKNGNLIIFAGAGISTEGKGFFPFSFYDDIKDELKFKKDISFPELMTRYTEKTKDKRTLLNKIKERIDYAKSFPDLYRSITEFHRELSTIYQIKEIITTNWDTFFEDECGAIPIVANSDFAFWDQPLRKVFKIHGSINNPGSIIATEEDYKKCYINLNKGIVGASLKHLLATKTIVFFGYSFRDYDFNRIYRYLEKDMKDILPHAYLVALNDSPIEKKFKRLPTIIKTDATYFIQVLKEKLIEDKQLIPDLFYDLVVLRLSEIYKVHFKLTKGNIKKNPQLIFCLSYQDGIIHAFERMIQLKNTGRYSHVCFLKESVDSYFKIRKKFNKARRYFDVAYIDGYIYGLLNLVPINKTILRGDSYYYIFGYGIVDSLKKYNKLEKKSYDFHRAAYKWAQNESKKYTDKIILQHTPFLMGVD